MRPTAADAHDGAERLLRGLVADGQLAPAAADPVLRLLRQARTGWSSRLPFLDDDSRTLLALLADLRRTLPVDLAAAITSHVGVRAITPLLDVEEADRRNAELRDLLARAVRVIPAGADRERIRVYLLDRVEREPF